MPTAKPTVETVDNEAMPRNLWPVAAEAPISPNHNTCTSVKLESEANGLHNPLPMKRKARGADHHATTKTTPRHPQTVDKHARGGLPRVPQWATSAVSQLANIEGRLATLTGFCLAI